MDETLYYECHVTIEPVFDERRDRVQALAEVDGFRLAALLMKKRAQDTEERSSKDTFMTKVVPATPEQLEALTKSMKTLVGTLQRYGFKVWRYKIEAALIDSRNRDEFQLLPGVPSATTPQGQMVSS